ncbi:MAG: hypothetical protein ACPIOQ_12370 [Promethearchaeia archaeon]
MRVLIVSLRVLQAERTVMLRATSKRTRHAVDLLRPPAVISVKRMWRNTCGAYEAVGLQQLLVLPWCCITSLGLNRCVIRAAGAAGLAQVLEQECAASLARLDLRENWIGDEGVTTVAHVLGDCCRLTQLDRAIIASKAKARGHWLTG